MPHLRALASALLLTSALVSGCGHARVSWDARPVQTSVVRISPAGIKARGDLLYVQTTFINVTSKPVMVDRDGVQLIMSDGRRVPRSSGTFTRHTPYVIPPGGSHAVYVDFRASGFDWNEQGQVALDFSQAVLIDGAPVQLPPMVLTSYGGA